MQELDKAAMGRRIRQIRSRAGLRQWELARILGTTQSAIHKYEHGVVPEPRRLIALARVGETSIEWILTGHHWDNGSEEQQRLSPELLRTASLLREIPDDGRASVDEALRVIREAVDALQPAADVPPSADPAALVDALRSHAPKTLKLLEDAVRIQEAIVHRVLHDASDRLQTSPLLPSRSVDGDGRPDV